MPDDRKHPSEELAPKTRGVESPLVFISHDSRDAELAEAFAKLLRSVSAGMLKTFHSSDKKGTAGIEYGDEWYKRVMVKLDSASDVVCLLTERSLERPWILYEAGVAKGKLQTPVMGIALGISLNHASTGPFYQFQNSDDGEDSLTKLVKQLMERIPTLEPDPDIIKGQVEEFKTKEAAILAKLQKKNSAQITEPPQETTTAKVLEELKVIVRDLPTNIKRQTAEEGEMPKRRPRRLHPDALLHLMHILPEGPSDPLGLLVLAGLVREDAPWLYELMLEAYRAAGTESIGHKKHIFEVLRRTVDFTIHGPFSKDIMRSEDIYRLYKEIDIYCHQIDFSKRARLKT